MNKLKICVFSDIHYIDEKPEWKVNRKLVEYAEPLTDKIIDKVNNEIKPDICINLGDMIQASKNKEKDLANLEYIWKKLQGFNVPFYTLIGNHELKSVESNKEIMDVLGYENATYGVDVNGYHLLFIGTDVNEEDEKYRTQYISDKDLAWIAEDLDANSDKKVIVFSHFGIAEDEMKGNFYYDKNPEGGIIINREKLKEILHKHKNILSVFCGHQHWTKAIRENGVPYYMLGALTENMNWDGIPDGVYFDVDAIDDIVRVREGHLKLDLKRKIMEKDDDAR